MTQDDLTAKQSDYAVFLPAISGFYATFVGKQRNEHYVDPARFPQGLTDMEQLNWLTPLRLYSLIVGHLRLEAMLILILTNKIGQKTWYGIENLARFS
jgi:hypothetical protein